MKRHRSISSSDDTETFFPARRIRPYRPAEKLISVVIDDTAPKKMVADDTDEPSKKHFLAKLKCIQDDHDTSDFTIICSGKEIKVHRLVLSLQSGYFALLFKSDFKVRLTVTYIILFYADMSVRRISRARSPLIKSHWLRLKR